MSSDDKKGGEKDKKSTGGKVSKGKDGKKVVTLGANAPAKPEAKAPKKASREKAAERSKARRKSKFLSKSLESDLAVAILEELYPLLLENCTDEDDEVDTQALFEVLAGMVGLFAADYQSHFGHEKAMSAVKDLLELSLALYQEHVGD